MALSTIELKLLEKAAENAEKAHTQSAATQASVSTIASQTKELFERVRETENGLVEMKTNYKACGARKAHEAGELPGNKSERKSLFWAMVGVIAAGSSVVAAIVVPIAKAFVEKILN